MELSKRLQELVSLAKPGTCAADVGCDHGYVSIYLAEHNLFEHIIAMDIRTGPLQSAENNIRKYRLEYRIETRLSDGIDKLCEGEADTLICAGMGGELILHILSQNLPLVKNMKQIILQPQSEIYKVRKFIRKNHLKITAESMVKEDGKYYPMMRVEKEDEREEEEKGTEESLRQQVEDEYGPILLQQKNDALKEYLQKELRITKEIITSLQQQLEKESQRIQNVKEESRINRRYKELKKKEKRIYFALSYFA